MKYKSLSAVRLTHFIYIKKKKKKNYPPVSETSVFHTAAEGGYVCEIVCMFVCVLVKSVNVCVQDFKWRLYKRLLVTVQGQIPFSLTGLFINRLDISIR